jgi:hypothetical protein
MTVHVFVCPEILVGECLDITLKQPTNVHPFQFIDPFNAELNSNCHLLALLGAHHIFHVSGLRVNHYNIAALHNVYNLAIDRTLWYITKSEKSS